MAKNLIITVQVKFGAPCSYFFTAYVDVFCIDINSFCNNINNPGKG